tara:strand:+ start:318 stop:515 length:198 start_codon:yes stop_codon:yes gene_type:complete
MKIKDIITMFQKYHDQDEELAITWWSIDDFEDDEEFQLALKNIDDIDWSDVYENLTEPTGENHEH